MDFDSSPGTLQTAPEFPVNDPKSVNRARFELELEFVQSLANPFYLHSLAQQNILEQPAFINFLSYLQYFKEKDYARFIQFLFATALSVYNKWMFSSDHFGFPYPLFVTTIHMFVQFILAAIMRTFWPNHFKPTNKPTVADYGKKALPTAIASSLDIGLSNFSLKTITLSFYTMCKSSSLIFVLLFAFLFRLETFSWRLVGVIFLIFSGVLLMVATETKFVLEGLVLVLSASAFGGLRWSLTQLLLRNRKMGLDNPSATIYWLAPSMGVTLALISIIVESWISIFRSSFFATLGKSLQTSIYLASPGWVIFQRLLFPGDSEAISFTSIIQRTGVVPMSIAGIAKEVTTITISAWFFGDQLTPLNITGVSITICGIILFTFHKYRKSIESEVPLDAHGNPIFPDGLSLSMDANGGNGYHVELEETRGLTSAPRASDELEVTACLLFEAPKV
ncbi:hypothetical protein C0991_000778 [Blastosporella zonata]|nr:hypothetical protein C0991_000778 [Blastosporella zonata]